MSDQLSITYKLVGTGWSECVLESNGQSAKISASYLSNALGNLVLSAVAVASGFRATAFGFDEEPGEYRWVIEAEGNNVVRLRVLEFQELWGNGPNETGHLVFEVQTAPVVYAKAVLACAVSVLAECGLKGYSEKWAEHSFPEREVALLENAIAGWEK